LFPQGLWGHKPVKPCQSDGYLHLTIRSFLREVMGAELPGNWADYTEVHRFGMFMGCYQFRKSGVE